MIKIVKTSHLPAWLFLFCSLTGNFHTPGGKLSAEMTTREDDRVAIKKVISDFIDDWNRHDSKALADLHAEDANVINIFGQWIRGRNNIEAT